MSSLSSHLLSSHSSSSSGHPSHPQLVQSNSGVYHPAMHGNFSTFGSSSRMPNPNFFPGPNTSFGSPLTGDSSFQDVSLATAQHIATLQAKLDKRLGPEYISQRPGGGGTLKSWSNESLFLPLTSMLKGPNLPTSKAGKPSTSQTRCLDSTDGPLLSLPSPSTL